MTHPWYAEDPEPSERIPAGPVHIPGRPGSAGFPNRVFCAHLGGRTAAGFTTEQRIAAPLGPEQLRIRLAEPALRALTKPLGVAAVTIATRLFAPAPQQAHVGAPWGPSTSRRRAHRRSAAGRLWAVGELRVEGVVAPVSRFGSWTDRGWRA